jgi:hypothetical protein
MVTRGRKQTALVPWIKNFPENLESHFTEEKEKNHQE